MSKSGPRLILAIDDDQNLLDSLSRILSKHGCRIKGAGSGEEAIAWLSTGRPDLILLDVVMPGMDGFETCMEIRSRKEFVDVPLVFITGQGEEADRQKAFAVGATDFIEKPFEVDSLLERIDKYLSQDSPKAVASSAGQAPPSSTTRKRKGAAPTSFSDMPPFPEFLVWLADQLPQAPGEASFRGVEAEALYEWGRMVGLNDDSLAGHIGDFTGIPKVPSIAAEDIELGVLPQPFCRARLIVPVRSTRGRRGIVVANPFDWELWEAIGRTPFGRQDLDVLIANPEVIRGAFVASKTKSPIEQSPSGGEVALDTDKDPGKSHPIAAKAISLLTSAVEARASDIHIEPKESETFIRVRIDGDMHDLETLPNNEAMMLVSRLKAVAGMNIAEKRRPQDNSVAARISGRPFKLRLATSSTPFGESMVIRLLEPSAEPMTLQDLGMSDGQADTIISLTNRSQGLILFVGPTGSGKSTSIYSLLSKVDTRRRSLMSVEDPVEYRIPFANQQQVNERAGVTFEMLLRSAVRQDPDILLLGEIRDLFSAKASMDFASSGHMTITTMHSSNATTAVFRLERLGVSRTDMSEALIGIVAQKLMKRLCEDCKDVRDISPEEENLLSAVTDDVPRQVAHAVGCPRCRNTGFYGREGLFEVIPFDVEMCSLVREGVPIFELREFARKRGDILISDQGLQKIRELIFPVQQVWESALAEESSLARPETPDRPSQAPIPSEIEVAVEAHAPPPVETVVAPQVGPPEVAEKSGPPTIMVVEDDKTARTLLNAILQKEGFEVISAEDGVDALLKLGNVECDLILSDINMPNLDGFKLLEIVTQRDLHAPVIFLTAEMTPEAELKGLDLGAADFIRKPIQRNVLIHRIRRILDS